MARENLEFKVGIFVMASLGILAWLVFKAGDLKPVAGYTVHFLFSSVRGVEEGSSVRLAGVVVGEVRGIRVKKNSDGQTQVEITAWIEKDVQIAEDAVVRIGSLGFLGEKFIEILPGISSQSIGQNGELYGKTPIELEDVAESGNQLIATVDATIANINEVMGDPKFRQNFKSTFSQAEVVTKNMVEVSENMREASQNFKDASKSASIILGRVRDGEGSVGSLLKNDKIAKDLEGLVADVKAHPWKLLKRG